MKVKNYLKKAFLLFLDISLGMFWRTLGDDSRWCTVDLEDRWDFVWPEYLWEVVLFFGYIWHDVLEYLIVLGLIAHGYYSCNISDKGLYHLGIINLHSWDHWILVPLYHVIFFFYTHGYWYVLFSWYLAGIMNLRFVGYLGYWLGYLDLDSRWWILKLLYKDWLGNSGT